MCVYIYIYMCVYTVYITTCITICVCVHIYIWVHMMHMLCGLYMYDECYAATYYNYLFLKFWLQIRQTIQS